MTILCGLDPATSERLTAALTGPVHVVTGLSAAAVTLQTNPGEHLVVVGTEVELHDAKNFTQHVRAERSDVAVILLRTVFDSATMNSALHAGIREVVAADDLGAIIAAIGRAELVQQVQPASKPPPASHRTRGRVITVYAAKGGCGKTTLATNLAVILNGDGERSVCLVDLDLEFGDVAVSLQLTPSRTIIDAIEDNRVDESNLPNLLTNYRPRFDCVLAPIEPGDAERIPVALVGQLIEVLALNYDFVVVDTPSQLSEHVLAAMDATHHFALLTTPEIPSLKNLRLALDMLDLLGYDPHARSIVFNRADARAGLSANEVETALKMPITVHVPSSHDVPASINRGVPLAVTSPKHPVTAAIRSLAEQVFLGPGTTSTDTAASRTGRRGLRLRMRSS